MDELGEVLTKLSSGKEVENMAEEPAMTMEDKIDHLCYDTDSIIKMLSGDKMSESFDSGFMAGLAQKAGIDPSTMAMLMNNNGGFGGNGWLFFLFLILLGRNGWGGWDGMANDYAKESTVLNQNNFNSLLNAINSTGTKQEMAIQNLATALGSDYNAVALSLASIDKELALTKGDVKSAIQNCCCNVRQEIASASAKTDLGIERASSANQLAIERTAAAEQLANEKQTRSIIDAIQNQNVLGMQQTQEILRQMQANQVEINRGFCDLKEREYQHIIEDLKARLDDQSQAAQTAQILAAVNAPRYTATSGTLDTTAGTYSGSGTVRL